MQSKPFNLPLFWVNQLLSYVLPGVGTVSAVRCRLASQLWWETHSGSSDRTSRGVPGK